MPKLMKGAVAVFAKTPSLSPVKTRLAANIGEVRAREFYYKSVAAVAETISLLGEQLPEISPYWAVGEQNGVTDKLWQCFPAIWTGEGDLGQRLYNVYNTLLTDHDYVILIGTDSPQLTKDTFKQTVDLLSCKPESCVIGPCYDGGFYLFAGAVTIAKKIWNNVAYSANTTCEELVLQLSNNDIHVQQLEICVDVDNFDDMVTLQRTLEMHDNLTAKQWNLYQWILSIK